MPLRTIAGHRRLLSLLSRAIARQTLPPALLFAGPPGVGKRRTAVATAEGANCLAPIASAALERDSCGECPSCRRIGRGLHPDVVVLEPGDSGSIKIEAVREVIDRAGFRPFEGRRRFVIVDKADALVEAAQNALLKTLEEPPSASVFILVSSLPDALLPTVRSRCQRLRFGALSAAEVSDVLVRDHGYSQSDARAAAADADGSIGQALEAKSVDLVEVRAAAQRLLEQAARVDDPARRLDAAKELTGKKATVAAERDQLAVLLRLLGALVRDLGILATGGDARWIVNTDLQQDLSRLATAFDRDRTVRAFAAIDRALDALQRNVSPKVVADWLVLQL
jgi:DNA polymerase-3 subunit delta'